MPAAPPTSRELDAYREQADRFDAEYLEEFYLHYSGQKETLELEEIYERHADLTRLDRVQAIGLAVAGDRRVRELWRFACHSYLGNLTRTQEERLAELEATLEATVDGETVPFRRLREVTANEEDRARRERLERARGELAAEHLNPVHLDGWRIVRTAVEDLGAPDYVELHRRFGFRLEELAAQARAFLDSTERLYERAADRLFRERVGIGLAEAERWDVRRLFRAPKWDVAFPRDRMLPALEATLSDLGIDLRTQANVHVDLESRPKKDPRAFCCPIEIPDRVVLCVQPAGGPDDWQALFHEAGHAEHYAHVGRDLPFEDKRAGDRAVSEGWAMVLQHLADDAAWLSRRLDFPRPQEFAAEGATTLLYIVRRYCAKLLYELELHTAPDPAALQSRYVELLADAVKIEPSPADYLADVDPGFYVSEYLRSWAFEAQLRAFLRHEFGSAWFARREAGSLLRELWSEGMHETADEILREVTGAEIELEAVTERVREALS